MSVTLHFGDCLNVMRGIEAGSVDLILADLPYGTTACHWDVVIPLEPLWAHYRRLLKPCGVVVLTASQPFTSLLVLSNREWFRHEWIWIKNKGGNFANTVREPFKEHESVLVFSSGRWTYNPQLQRRSPGGLDRAKYGRKAGRKDTGIYHTFEYVPSEYNDPELRVPSSWQWFSVEKGSHPSQKPVALMEYLIQTYSNEDDTVLDNAMGSGTAGVACIRTGRNFIGIENHEPYFRIAERRIAAAHAAAPLLSGLSD